MPCTSVAEGYEREEDPHRPVVGSHMYRKAYFYDRTHTHMHATYESIKRSATQRRAPCLPAASQPSRSRSLGAVQRRTTAKVRHAHTKAKRCER